MGVMSELDMQLRAISEAMGEPSSPQEIAEDRVARAVREAFESTSELYRLSLDPKTAALIAREAGEIWAIYARMDGLVKHLRNKAAA